jgi:hypothetical protein
MGMPREWDATRLVDYIAAAGAKGRTKDDLRKKIARGRNAPSLDDLRASGAIKGPFKRKSEYYFAPQFAPTAAQAEDAIEAVLRDANTKLTSKSGLEKKTTGFLKVFFSDALAALKAEVKIVELRGGQTIYYVHRETLLEQLRLADDGAEPRFLHHPSARSSRSADITLEDIRPVYEKLKSEQGGIGTVRIYDIMTRLGAAKESLHRLLVDEAKIGRVTLHAASTVKFPPEVMAAGIRLEGQPDLLVTVVLRTL